MRSLWRKRRKPSPMAEIPVDPPPPPPLTAEQFIGRFARNYIHYAALLEVAFAGPADELLAEYGRLSEADRMTVVRYARDWAQRAR